MRHSTTLFPSPIGAVFTVFLTLFEITLSRRRRWQLFLQPHFIVCHKEEENICSNSDEYDLHLYGFIPVMGFLKQWMALVCTHKLHILFEIRIYKLHNLIREVLIPLPEVKISPIMYFVMYNSVVLSKILTIVVPLEQKFEKTDFYSMKLDILIIIDIGK